MIGGYGVFGSSATAETTINDLPEHEYLSIEFTFFIGDSWDNEWFYLTVDGVTVKSV